LNQIKENLFCKFTIPFRGAHCGHSPRASKLSYTAGGQHGIAAEWCSFVTAAYIPNDLKFAIYHNYKCCGEANLHQANIKRVSVELPNRYPVFLFSLAILNKIFSIRSSWRFLPKPANRRQGFYRRMSRRREVYCLLQLLRQFPVKMASY
jgi:hypothetical protein